MFWSNLENPFPILGLPISLCWKAPVGGYSGLGAECRDGFFPCSFSAMHGGWADFWLGCFYIFGFCYFLLL